MGLTERILLLLCNRLEKQDAPLFVCDVNPYKNTSFHFAPVIDFL